jgi:hypothetical protein
LLAICRHEHFSKNVLKGVHLLLFNRLAVLKPSTAISSCTVLDAVLLAQKMTAWQKHSIHFRSAHSEKAIQIVTKYKVTKALLKIISKFLQ